MRIQYNIVSNASNCLGSLQSPPAPTLFHFTLGAPKSLDDPIYRSTQHRLSLQALEHNNNLPLLYPLTDSNEHLNHKTRHRCPQCSRPASESASAPRASFAAVHAGSRSRTVTVCAPLKIRSRSAPRAPLYLCLRDGSRAFQSSRDRRGELGLTEECG